MVEHPSRALYCSADPWMWWARGDPEDCASDCKFAVCCANGDCGQHGCVILPGGNGFEAACYCGCDETGSVNAVVTGARRRDSLSECAAPCCVFAPASECVVDVDLEMVNSAIFGHGEVSIVHTYVLSLALVFQAESGSWAQVRFRASAPYSPGIRKLNPREYFQ